MRASSKNSISALLRASVSPWLLVFTMIAASHAQDKITFRDITAQAGIHFADNDGWPDVLLVNGQDWPGHAKSGATTLQLYHNNHDGTFTDVTRKSGLDISLFGLGVAVGDYDNDGFDDIFITAVGQSHLFHNHGNGTFAD